MRNICIITGATGFIGQRLSGYLVNQGYQVVGLSRNPEKIYEKTKLPVKLVRWNPDGLDGWETVMKNAAVVINLAGENISGFRWTPKSKEKILLSRTRSSRTLIDAIEKTENRPDVFIQVSGIGYYGSRKDDIMDEYSSPGEGFLSRVSQRWEAASEQVEAMKIRRVVFRTGMVLGPRGGALIRLIMPFRFFLGARFGSGNQWTPWIHILDVCRAMEYAISHINLKGVFNLTAPQAVTNKEMTRTLGKILKKPSFFVLPAWIIKIILGEMGRELLLSSQRVVPRRLVQEGFEFSYPDLKKALSEILS
jgi:uncharacterized protein (TIGR01777 family)